MSRKVAKFILRQINQIREGGLSVLFQKLCKIPLFLLALPMIFLVRLLRPLILIRFGRLESRRFGHFIADTEMYLAERDAGMAPPRTFDIFYHYLPICNFQVKKMWERTRKLHISPFTGFTQVLDRVNRLLPGGERHMILTSPRDIYGLYARTKSHLSFTPEEERLGRQGLQKLGITDGASFVCFSARDLAYLDTVYPDYNWRYQDHRDVSIYNYVPAVQELTRRGYFMVRMGAVVKEPLRTNNPKIIDYAVKGRTDFLDIYLGAKCRFFLSDTCGINEVSRVFRRPIVYANFIPLGVDNLLCCAPESLFIPKKLWLRKKDRLITFPEMLNSEVGNFSKSEQYEQLGIEVIENTPEEINDVAVEMDERLKGTRKSTEEDEELQRRFWSIYEAHWPHRKILSRVGAEFLRQNQELLD